MYPLDSAESTLIPRYKKTLSPAQVPKQEKYEPTNPVDLASFRKSTEIPIGFQIPARSGNKGANINVAFFP